MTMAFLVVGWSSILHIFNVRSKKSVFVTPINDNYPLAILAASMIILFAIMVAIPKIGYIFGLEALSATQWLVTIILSLIPSASREIGLLIDHFLKRRRHLREAAERYRTIDLAANRAEQSIEQSC